MNDPRVFFQIAASLIPALIFGGLISNKLRPPKNFPTGMRSRMAGMGVVIGVCTVIFWAEVDAISVGLTGNPTRGQVWAVAIVLVSATAATVGAIAWPWVPPLAPANRVDKAILLVGGLVLFVFLVVLPARCSS